MSNNDEAIKDAMSTLGAVKARARATALEVLTEAAKRGYHAKRLWGFNSDLSKGWEHPSGLAIDFMVYENRAMGRWFADYLKKHHERLGVRWIIWEQHVWNPLRASEGWRLMEDRGSVTANHFDHVHALFAEGAYRPIPKPAPPTKPPYKALMRGMVSDRVYRLQKGLLKVFPAYAYPIRENGGPIRTFGPATERAVREFQRRSGMRVTGVVDEATAKALARYHIDVM